MIDLKQQITNIQTFKDEELQPLLESSKGEIEKFKALLRSFQKDSFTEK